MTDTTTVEDDASVEQTEVEKVTAKNADLLKKLATAKTKTTQLEARLQALEDAQTEADATAQDTANLKSKAEQDLAALQRKYTKLQNDFTTLTTAHETVVIDGVIATKLAEAGVDPKHLPVVASYLRSGAKVEGGEAIVNGMALGEHITTFLEGDGAIYRPAPAHSGGGATGSTAKAMAVTKDNVNYSELAKLPAPEANAALRSAGLPEVF